MTPQWKQPNLFLEQDDVEAELRQCQEEGRDISSVEDEFERFAAANMSAPETQRAFLELLDRTINLPLRADCDLHEPSDLEGIRAARPAAVKLTLAALNDEVLLDKIHGAWLGRCCGCLLGKPIEGWFTDRAWSFMKETDNFPLRRYMRSDVASELQEKYRLSYSMAWANQVNHMPEDDDTNYTVIGLQVMKQRGAGFTSEDVASFWFHNVPIGHMWTAERAGMRNLAMMIQPPHTATFRNPYREWIGAQIRADFFGYAAPGNPERAAEWAWRDARITHVKNGIYGEMWVAAMLAAAAVCDDVRTVIKAGLAQIPERSRLARSVRDVMSWRENGLSYDEAVKRIHTRWNERVKHHWCHTISNAEIVAVGLLWGEKDLGLSICRAVQPCFDTDCNGATAGSIIGMILGATKLPREWVDHLHDTLHTGIAGYYEVKISEMARETLSVIKALK